jgi:Uma2 family endonuclease
VKKLPVYAGAGIPHVWLVDPANQTLEVFALDRDHWIVAATHAADDRARVAPFGGRDRLRPWACHL